MNRNITQTSTTITTTVITKLSVCLLIPLTSSQLKGRDTFEKDTPALV